MTVPENVPLPGRVFAVAQGHLADARRRRELLLHLWNSTEEPAAFTAWMESPTASVREMWCSFNPDPDTYVQANQAISAFFRSVKQAMDACVHAAAAQVCRSLGTVPPEQHQMLLASDEAEFDALLDRGHLQGLRPDQVETVRFLQPFNAGADAIIQRAIAHLASALATPDEADLFTAWASEARPEPAAPPDVSINSWTVDPAGPMRVPKRLATFEIQTADWGATLAGNPNVSFDPIAYAEPWPLDPDDNFATRSRALLTLTEHFIEGMQRSVNAPYRTDLLSALDQHLPADRVDPWLPINFGSAPHDESRVREAIAESEAAIAAYLNDDGTLTYVRLNDDDRVVAREIAPAAELLGDSVDGIAVEEAVRASAGRWGLPDLVLHPKVLRKGKGVRELGDGTILAGHRGIALQVKSRQVLQDPPDKAERWLLKNAADGLRQARGTIRSTLSNPDVEVTSLRGRPVALAGSRVTWLPVVVLDHPNPPLGVIPAADPRGRSVVMMRRDWEFLWDQLRSTTAIVNYLHRVSEADDPIELGAEINRYFDLAHRDENAPPNPAPEWADEADVRQPSLPLLPRDPAGSADELGHAIFRQVLEDVATSDFTGNESDRIRLLSHIDRYDVTSRAEVGRLLLQRLITCAEAAPGGHRMGHRIIYLDDGELHLAFSTMSQLTGYHRELYTQWLLHRRQTFLSRYGARGPIYPWTVGVLLTPRVRGPRPWDTAVIATNGPPGYDEAEFERLTRLFEPTE